MIHFSKTQHFVLFLEDVDWDHFDSLRHLRLAVYLYYFPMDGDFLSPRWLTGLRLWYKLTKDFFYRWQICRTIIRDKSREKCRRRHWPISHHLLEYISGTRDATFCITSQNFLDAAADTDALEQIFEFRRQNCRYYFWGNLIKYKKQQKQVN